MCVHTFMHWFRRSSPLIFKELVWYNTEAPHLKWSQSGLVDYKTYWQLNVDSCLERDWGEMEEGQGKNLADQSFISPESLWGKNQKGLPRVEMEGASTTKEMPLRTRIRSSLTFKKQLFKQKYSFTHRPLFILSQVPGTVVEAGEYRCEAYHGPDGLLISKTNNADTITRSVLWRKG